MSQHTLQDVKDRLQKPKWNVKKYVKEGTVSPPAKTDEAVNVPILNRGISLGFLLALTESFKLHDMDTATVVREFITPVTSATTENSQPTRFSELPCFQEYFGKADTFISHCWKGKWGDLVSACLDGGHPLSRIVWIDIFAVTQHPQLEALQDDLAALQSVIEGVEYGTTLVWNPKVQIDNESNPVLRAWCLFEIHTTVVKDQALVIKMGGRDADSDTKSGIGFRFTTESNEDTVTKLVFSTDIRNAKASYPEDLERIQNMIKEQGGFDELNTRVRTAVYNNWRIMKIPAVQYALSNNGEKVTSFLNTFDSKTYTGDPGGSLLHDLVHGNLCSAAQLAIDCGATIDNQTDKGNTPLMFAAEGGRVRMCKLLIEHGAKLDLQNGKKETALHLAAKYGRVEAVKFFLAAGADDSILDSGDYTPAGLAKLNKMPGCKECLAILDPDSVEAEYQCLGFDASGILEIVNKLKQLF